MKVSLLLLLLVSLLVAATTATSSTSTEKQDYQQEGIITAFILPHSHDDVGWIVSIQDYYDVFVRYIYDQVIQALVENPARRFIVVEQAYFTLWWETTADELQKRQTHQLVKNGQLEFVIGGWTMEDEACTTYSTNIDQMTLGHKFIKETFGVVPRFGWQIDPFGASTVVHEHYALMGFDATVIDRIPERWKNAYRVNQTMEFVWRPSASWGDQLEIFTHTMYDGYCIPVAHLDFETGQIAVSPQNIKDKADSIVANIKQRSTNYRTPNILFPYGCDFAHWWSTWMFYNMDQLVDYINNRSSSYGVKVQYATLSEFFDAVHSSNYPSWPVRGPTDFFPYNDDDVQYWSGFYTSRNALKGWARSRETVLRTAESLHALSMPPWGSSRNASSLKEDLTRLHALRAANGEATHHDAVSGTSTYWVVAMYDEHEAKGAAAVEPVITQALAALCVPGHNTTQPPQLTLDPTVIQTLVQKGSQVALVVYNPLGWELKGTYLSLPVSYNTGLQVVSAASGKTVPTQIVPAKKSCPTCPCQVAGTCGVPAVNAPYTLHFQADIPPMGFSTYLLSKAKQTKEAKDQSSSNKEKVDPKNTGKGVVSIENSILRVDFDSSTGLLQAITNKKSGKSAPLTQSFFQYTSNTTPLPISREKETLSSPHHDNTNDNKRNKHTTVKSKQDMIAEVKEKLNSVQGRGAAGGAYVFHPIGNATVLVDKPVSWQLITGPYVNELRQEWAGPCNSSPLQGITCGVYQVFRLYNSAGNEEVESVLEILNDVGPLAVNKNFITRFNTSFNNNREIYTDDNCFEMHKREYVPAGSGVDQKGDPIGGNYYPATCMTFTRDSQKDLQLTFLFDRTHGASSQFEGSLEIMYHRRVLSTDYKGPLNLDDSDHLENIRTFLLFGSVKESTQLRHKLQYLLNFPPTIGYSELAASPAKWPYLPLWSPLAQSFPDNIHLLSLLQYNNTVNDTLLLRLVHLFEKDEDAVLSSPVTLDLSKYFSFATIESMDERALTGALPVSAIKNRWKWSTEGNNNHNNHYNLGLHTEGGQQQQVTLNPAEIKTFFITLK